MFGLFKKPAVEESDINEILKAKPELDLENLLEELAEISSGCVIKAITLSTSGNLQEELMVPTVQTIVKSFNTFGMHKPKSSAVRVRFFHYFNRNLSRDGAHNNFVIGFSRDVQYLVELFLEEESS